MDALVSPSDIASKKISAYEVTLAVDDPINQMPEKRTATVIRNPFTTFMSIVILAYINEIREIRTTATDNQFSKTDLMKT